LFVFAVGSVGIVGSTYRLRHSKMA